MQDVAVTTQPFLFLLGPPGPFVASSTGGSGGEGAILTGAFANPNGNLIPADPTAAAWYYQEGAIPNWWQWNVTTQSWNQGAG